MHLWTDGRRLCCELLGGTVLLFWSSPSPRLFYQPIAPPITRSVPILTLRLPSKPFLGVSRLEIRPSGVWHQSESGPYFLCPPIQARFTHLGSQYPSKHSQQGTRSPRRGIHELLLLIHDPTRPLWYPNAYCRKLYKMLATRQGIFVGQAWLRSELERSENETNCGFKIGLKSISSHTSSRLAFYLLLSSIHPVIPLSFPVWSTLGSFSIRISDI